MDEKKIDFKQNDTNNTLLDQKKIVQVLDNIYAVQLQEDIDEIISPEFPLNGEFRLDEICFYQIKKLVYDEEFPQKEAFENVLMSLDSPYYNFVYILSGDQNGVALYIGVVKNGNQTSDDAKDLLSASDYGKNIANIFYGNFNGSELKKLNVDDLKNLVNLVQNNNINEENIKDEIIEYENAGIITGIPSIMELQPGKENQFQGIDRLINSMLSNSSDQTINWRMVVVCEPVPWEEILKQQNDIYALYNQLSEISKVSVSVGKNNSINVNANKNENDTRTKSLTLNDNQTVSSNNSFGTSSDGYSSGKGKAHGISTAHTDAYGKGIGFNIGNNYSFTGEIINKHIQELMKYIDEELLIRIKQGLSRGWFKTSIYYMADKPVYATRLKAGIKALMQGNKSLYSPLISQTIATKDTKKFLYIYQNLDMKIESLDRSDLMLLGRPYEKQKIGLYTYLTPEEICVVAGLPQEEVPGIPMREGVSFALNEDAITPPSESFQIGNIIQKKSVLAVPFYLEKKNLSKHMFIAGVTGSGKTTTCHKILKEADVPFLVIEPAKTEYRTLLQEDADIIVFSLGNEQVAPFRINPFELIPGENISAHIDMLKAAFTSAFPMEGSMPQIMEEAIIKCYENHGWDIVGNENVEYGESAFKSEIASFPILSELLVELQNVVKEKHFGDRLGAEYAGSLVSRISNLTVGTKGSMLNCYHSIDFEFLAKSKVILELEEMRAPEDKALVMGFILARLFTVVKKMHKANNDYKHITLIEEAHRLLKKIEPNGNGAQKAAVEAFADLLAEVRKYGEGLIIVDQIPNKLAVEVLKNTNTKIIHRILAKDDKDAVGDTMMLNDKQKTYLSSLAVGETIIYSENTERPVQVKIQAITDTNEAEIDEEEIRKRFKKICLDELKYGFCYKDYHLQRLRVLFSRVISKIKTSTKDISFEEGHPAVLVEEIKKIEKKYNFCHENIWKKLIKYSGRGGSKYSTDDYEKMIEDMVFFFVNVSITGKKIMTQEELGKVKYYIREYKLR